jgi:predicted small integral membrane protein
MGKLKNLFNGIKSWLISNGIEGILGLALGLILWSFGYKIFAGFSFGVFATRNWDILVNFISKKINKK